MICKCVFSIGLNGQLRYNDKWSILIIVIYGIVDLSLLAFLPKHMLLYASEHILCRHCQAMTTVIYKCITWLLLNSWLQYYVCLAVIYAIELLMCYMHTHHVTCLFKCLLNEIELWKTKSLTIGYTTSLFPLLFNMFPHNERVIRKPILHHSQQSSVQNAGFDIKIMRVAVRVFPKEKTLLNQFGNKDLKNIKFTSVLEITCQYLNIVVSANRKLQHLTLQH